MDVDQLQAGLTRNIDRMNRLEREISAIQKAVEGLIAMEDALKGEGGQAIRDFYTSCHLPFLQYFLTFKEEFNIVLQQAQQALATLEPVEAGHIVEEFLETDVEKGLTESADVTAALTDEANAIMDEVSDIIGLTKLDDTLVQESIADAKTKRDYTVEALNTFDSTQTTQLTSIETSIQSMKEWVQNIEGLFKEGLTDVDFPSDKWSGIASNSSLGMAIAAQQAPVGSVAYAMYEQHQLDMMLQASLSNMAPIQFGLGGYARMSYPMYGPMMLGLGNLSPGDGTGGAVQQVSGSADSDLEEVQAKRGKDESDSGKTEWLASSAKGIFNFFTEDIQTLVDPEASVGEKFEAAIYTFFKPAKVADKIADVAKGMEKAADAVDDVKDVGKTGKGIDNPLLPTEGKVGTFKELAKQGTAFDNITPHHMPSAAKMKQAGVKRNDGVSMNMEQPHPGTGGRHRETYTYGLSGNKLEEYLNLSYRDALTHDILDARRIYMKGGVYTPEIRAGLLNTIRKNRELYPELFNK